MDDESKLPAVTERLILHWGEMGTKWGINRTVAQIHALLYLSPEPLNAEQIAETLGIARSNVSMSLKELQGWGIVQTVSQLGDRRDYFHTYSDVWELFRIILAERKKRETDPTVEVLRSCHEELRSARNADPFVTQRVGAMLEFFETMTTSFNQLQRLPTPVLAKLTRMSGKLARLVGLEK